MLTRAKLIDRIRAIVSTCATVHDYERKLQDLCDDMRRYDELSALAPAAMPEEPDLRQPVLAWKRYGDTLRASLAAALRERDEARAKAAADTETAYLDLEGAEFDATALTPAEETEVKALIAAARAELAKRGK